MRNTFKLWLEFEEVVVPDAAELNDNQWNASITLADGRRYAVSMCTFSGLVKICQDPSCFHNPALLGKYWECPDLLVERMDRAFLEEVFDDMIDRGALAQWLVEEAEHGNPNTYEVVVNFTEGLSEEERYEVFMRTTTYLGGFLIDGGTEGSSITLLTSFGDRATEITRAQRLLQSIHGIKTFVINQGSGA